MAEFEVFVSKAEFKFNCAHFIAYPGFRERLHGHNYRASVKVVGSDFIGQDGYLIDFGEIKKATKEICKSINEYFICPMKTRHIDITQDETQLCLLCDDGAKFSFPKTDCAMLPLYHSSAEELAHWLWCQIIRKIGLERLQSRGLQTMEVSIAEAPMQFATFRCQLPSTVEALEELANREFNMRPRACFAASEEEHDNEEEAS